MSVYANNLDFTSSLDLEKVIEDVIEDVKSNLTNEQLNFLRGQHGELEYLSLTELKLYITNLNSKAQDILSYLNTVELIYVLDKISYL